MYYCVSLFVLLYLILMSFFFFLYLENQTDLSRPLNGVIRIYLLQRKNRKKGKKERKVNENLPRKTKEM